MTSPSARTSSRATTCTISGLPSGAVAANTPVTLHVTYNKADMVPGQAYKGELLLGPTTAPTAISVPVTITR